MANNLFLDQAGEAMEEEYDCDKAEAIKWNDCHFPSPISTLEPSVLTESCFSTESMLSSITEGNNSARISLAYTTIYCYLKQ